MNTQVKVRAKTSMMYLLDDILDEITWGSIAERYFPERSISWFYGKLRGIDGNGGEGHFTLAEKIQLANALSDFSDRVRNAADLVRAEV